MVVRERGNVVEGWPGSVAVTSVELSSGRCRFFEVGTGEPVIVLHGANFLHGAESWLKCAAGLAPGLRVLMPDLPGWGHSSPSGFGDSFAYLVDFVREFQDALGLTSTHVVGHSMGGWISLLLGYESAARVDRLVAVSSGGLNLAPAGGMIDWRAPSAADVDTWGRPLAELGWPIESAVATRKQRIDDASVVASFRKVMDNMTLPERRRHYHVGRRLPFIPHETLLLWGGLDRVQPVELGQEMARLLPRAELRVVDGGGHGIPTTHTAEVSAAIHDFLTR
jgi:pimeloyl-ACP methyl ester carboxylesterase